ncbi:TPA: HNH endonuclease [Yersinia enterocolitica]|nr:HNH endonuclease [Yersinia enterocolitica]
MKKDAVNFNDYFIYNPTDGKLRWKIPKGNVLLGEEAGSPNGEGYLRVGLNCKTYAVHRIAWEIYMGPIPAGMQIDHIDHNRINNKIENLRVVTNEDNCKNRSLQRDNSSGVCGVTWDKSKKKWYSQIMVNNKQINLGRFHDINEAISARKDAEISFGFHGNHGKG